MTANSSVLAMPSMNHFNHVYEAMNTPEYSVFGYLANIQGLHGAMTRLRLLKALAENGNKPFFGADLFGACPELGGWVNGLSIWGIIKETGNVREIMVQIDGDLYRKCPIKEWELALDVALLRTLLDEFKTVLMAQF